MWETVAQAVINGLLIGGIYAPVSYTHLSCGHNSMKKK